MMCFMCCNKRKKQSVEGGENELLYCQGFCGKVTDKETFELGFSKKVGCW